MGAGVPPFLLPCFSFLALGFRALAFLERVLGGHLRSHTAALGCRYRGGSA